MKKRKLTGVLIFALFFLMLGRNLSFLPKINLSGNQELSLKKDVQNIIKGKPGFYSVYYRDLNSGKNFGIDENQIETGASINKVPIVTVLYYLTNKGVLSLDDKITIGKKDLQDYGTGSIRYQKMPQTYSLRNLAKLTLRESDNTAAHVLGVKLGTNKTQKIINSWGLTQTDMAKNKTTVYDMSLLFEKIYKGEVTNPANTKELLSFLTESNFENRLPKDLPSETKIYHKTGDGEGFVHDVGIVEDGENVYFLGIMTSDIGDTREQTEKSIAEISKKIFTFLSG